MQVKITTAGGSDVWSTVQCRSALPTSDLTLYRDTPTPVTLTWSSRESDDSCSTHTAWAQPGNYQVTGVALGGQPDEAPFALAAPTLAPKPSPTATATTSAKPTATAKASATVTTKSTPKASTSPSPTTRHQKHPVAD
jgi:Tfp pilus assembly major pilin PilA